MPEIFLLFFFSLIFLQIFLSSYLPSYFSLPLCTMIIGLLELLYISNNDRLSSEALLLEFDLDLRLCIISLNLLRKLSELPLFKGSA